jgi:hypothetical protein
MNKTTEYTVSHCPFSQSGLDRCYHMQPDSRKVYLVITYCKDNHLDFDIYNELVNSDLIANQKVTGDVK